MAEEGDNGITSFIMHALTDDYESLETLTHYSTHPTHNSFSVDEITKALLELETQGLIQPFCYSDKEQSFQSVVFSITELKTLWFGLTKNGRAYLSRHRD